MPTNVKVDDLKINKLTKAQYEAAVQGGTIGEYELSVLTDDDTYATSEQLTQGLATKQDTISDLATIRSGAAAGATAVQPAAIADMETQTHASATYATKAELADKQDIMQYSTMPTASADNVGDIVQFVGTTDSTYTNGYFYKCTESSGSYSWVQTDVQPSSGGSSYTAGTGIDITNNVISNTGLINNATSTFPYSVAILGSVANTARDYLVVIGYAAEAKLGAYGSVVIGDTASASGSESVAIGRAVVANSGNSVAIGLRAKTTGSTAIAIGSGSNSSNEASLVIGAGSTASARCAIQLGSGWNVPATNSTPNTVKVANENGNFEIMSADGTIPEARLADTTNATAGQVLTLDSNLVATWATPSGGGASAPTLTWYTVSTAGNTLTIADTSSAQLVKVYKNGLLLQPTEDYSISGTTLTTVTAMVVGDKITTEVF